MSQLSRVIALALVAICIGCSLCAVSAQMYGWSAGGYERRPYYNSRFTTLPVERANPRPYNNYVRYVPARPNNANYYHYLRPYVIGNRRFVQPTIVNRAPRYLARPNVANVPLRSVNATANSTSNSPNPLNSTASPINVSSTPNPKLVITTSTNSTTMSSSPAARDTLVAEPTTTPFVPTAVATSTSAPTSTSTSTPPPTTTTPPPTTTTTPPPTTTTPTPTSTLAPAPALAATYESESIVDQIN